MSKEDKEVIRDSPHGSIRSKFYLINLVAFYNRVTASVNKEIATDIISGTDKDPLMRVFDPSPNKPDSKSEAYGFDG